MKSLYDQLTKHKCDRHESPYCFIYKGDVLCNQSRMMCDKCSKLLNSNQLISIRNAFEYLQEVQIKGYESNLRHKSMMWQKFKHNYDTLLEVLKEMEHKIEILINSIVENEVIRTLRTKSEQGITKQNIDSIGEYLFSVIDSDNAQQYCLKQEIELRQLRRFNQYKEVIQEQKQTIYDWNILLDSVQVKDPKKEIKNQMQGRITRSISIQSYAYKQIQTIKLKDVCLSLSLNQSATHLVATSKKVINVFKLYQGQWTQEEISSQGHTDLIRQVKINHNSTQIASCGDDSQIIIWRQLLSGKWSSRGNLRNHNDKVQSICFNHTSNLLVSGSVNGTILIHILKNDQWEFKVELGRHQEAINDLCFNHDSTLVASGSHDKQIILWKLNQLGEAQQIGNQKLIGHTQPISKVSFNSVSTQLVSCSWDKTIKVWEVGKYNLWSCLHTLAEHTDIVRCAQFNKQSNVIVSSSHDKLIKIWSNNFGSKWKCIQNLNEHHWNVNCVVISSDSETIISGSDDSTIKIHKLILQQ